MTVKKVKRNMKINLEDYVNSDTGEELMSELKGVSFVAQQDTNLVYIHSDDYFTIDSKAMIYLSQFLNRSELGSINVMATDLKTVLNLVFNGNIPHTNDTLQQKLGISSTSTFTLLIRKLMKLGVLYQIKGKIMGEVRVVYMMNPFLARKRKTVDEQVVKVFDELRDGAK